jgi:flagellin
MRNKAEAGASDTMGTSERQALIDQMVAYSKQIDDVVAQTKWTSSSPSLIGGNYLNTALTFQTGVDQGETTTLSGLADMRASNGVNSLNIAQSVAASRSTANNSGVVVASAAGAPSNSNLTELANGTYRVAVDYGADGTAAQVQLFVNGSSSPLFIDCYDEVFTDAIDTAMTMNLSAFNRVIDFGNGLTVTIAQGTSGTASGTVDYAKSGGTYELRLSTGAALSAASSASDFAQYMADINGKLDTVSGQLAQIGAMNGRLTFKEDQISTAQINVEGAYNRIMNANMAEEQVNASKYLILQQTATAMLSQANAAPQFLLSLFR